MSSTFVFNFESVIGKIDLEKLETDILESSPQNEIFNIFKSRNDLYVVLSSPFGIQEAEEINSKLTAYKNKLEAYPKIYDLVSQESQKLPYHEMNYKTQINSSLFPKRYFLKGELQKVDWFSDEELNNLVLVVDISYTRDAMGFALERTTTRKWVLSDGDFADFIKITKKKYTTNAIDRIIEGKRRRQNIVDAVQIPVLSFLIEAASDPENEYGLQPSTVLLLGRDFLDRFNQDFKKFIDNSSTVTDVNDPNFGLKKVVVNLQNAASTTDQWLNFSPVALGEVTILEYLTNEFSI